MLETSFIKVLIIKYNSRDERFSKDDSDTITPIYSVSAELSEC